MFPRATLLWLALVVLAILNGSLRTFCILPLTGEKTAHVLSSLLLSALIFGFTWITASWMNYQTVQQAWMTGGLWLVLTAAFEFLAGHYLFGASWEKLFSDYNLMQGRIWILILITTFISPLAVYHLKQTN